MCTGLCALSDARVCAGRAAALLEAMRFPRCTGEVRLFRQIWLLVCFLSQGTAQPGNRHHTIYFSNKPKPKSQLVFLPSGLFVSVQTMTLKLRFHSSKR